MNNKAMELYAKASAGLEYLRRSQRGQGTIEYVGILFIVAAICLAVLTFVKDANGDSIGNAIMKAVTDAISKIKW